MTPTQGTALPARGSHALPELPALTGLRFFAAFFVLIGHASSFLVKLSPDPIFFRSMLSTLVAVGMTLFFVLSGFVIHYNYADVGRSTSAAKLARFYGARFARLYPLFAFLLIFELGFRWNASDWPAVPFYATLSQSWIFVLLDGQSILTHLTVSQVTWSVSTEWFFYCWYPVTAWLIARQGRAWATVLILATVLLCMTAYVYAYLHQGPIDAFATRLWGATAASGGNNSFFIWLLTFAPIARIQEFLLGVLAAHVFIGTSARPPTTFESRVAVLLLGAVLLIVAMMMLAHGGLNFGVPNVQINSATVFVYPFAVAVIIFCCARYRSIFASFMSLRWVVICGDASYSIYMFHLVVLRSIDVNAVYPLEWPSIAFIATRFVLGSLLIIIFSIAMYRFYEIPSRIATREFLARYFGPGLGSAAPALLVALLVGAPLVAAAAGWYISLR